MTPEELTQVVTAHQSAIARGESRLDRTEAILERIAVGQEENRQKITQLADQQEVNQQAIAQLTASILELRHIVSDYIQGRSQTE